MVCSSSTIEHDCTCACSTDGAFCCHACALFIETCREETRSGRHIRHASTYTTNSEQRTSHTTIPRTVAAARGASVADARGASSALTMSATASATSAKIKQTSVLSAVVGAVYVKTTQVAVHSMVGKGSQERGKSRHCVKAI